MSNTEQHVGLLITPGKHGITEHRIAILDCPFPVEGDPSDVAAKWQRLGYVATESIARDRANDLAVENNMEVYTYHMPDTYYHLVPK